MKRFLIGAAAMLLLLATLSACNNKTPNVTVGKTTLPSTTDAQTEESTQPSIDYGALMDAPFANLSENPAEDFLYEEEQNEIILVKYQGTAKKVRIPASIGGLPVTSIADGAFADAKELTALWIPDEIRTLGEGILSGCNSIYALRAPLMGENTSSAQYLGYLFGAPSYEKNALSVPVSLELFVLGGEGEKISAFAFYDCNDLVSVRIPTSVRTVEKFAFYNCQKLCYVNMDTLVSVAEYAFASCAALEEICFGNALCSIGKGAFEGCGSIRSATLPFVGGSATEHRFLGYIFGADVADFNRGYVPVKLREITLLEGCTSIGANAFYECVSLRKILLPTSLVTIGTRAFGECTALQSIRLPDGMTTVGANAFFGCTGLREITLGSRLTTLGINAFYNCTALRAVILPDAMTELPASAFAGCRSLQSVSLGGVTKVGKNAFRGCSALTEVAARGTVSFAEGNEIIAAFFAN